MKLHVCAAVCLLWTQAASATNYYVAKTGNNGNAGTFGSPYLTVTKGESMSRSAGDTLFIGPGEYDGGDATTYRFYNSSGTALNYNLAQTKANVFYDSNSIYSAPLMTDPANGTFANRWTAFSLQAGSPCRTAGRGGAFQDYMGAVDPDTTPPPPAARMNVIGMVKEDSCDVYR